MTKKHRPERGGVFFGKRCLVAKVEVGGDGQSREDKDDQIIETFLAVIDGGEDIADGLLILRSEAVLVNFGDQVHAADGVLAFAGDAITVQKEAAIAEDAAIPDGAKQGWVESVGDQQYAEADGGKKAKNKNGVDDGSG